MTARQTILKAIEETGSYYHEVYTDEMDSAVEELLSEGKIKLTNVCVYGRA